MPPRAPVLPLEILTEIINQVTQKADLLALRLVNWTLNCLASPFAFHQIYVTCCSLRDLQGLIELQGSPFAGHVQDFRIVWQREGHNDGQLEGLLIILVHRIVRILILSTS